MARLSLLQHFAIIFWKANAIDKTCVHDVVNISYKIATKTLRPKKASIFYSITHNAKEKKYFYKKLNAVQKRLLFSFSSLAFGSFSRWSHVHSREAFKLPSFVISVGLHIDRGCSHFSCDAGVLYHWSNATPSPPLPRGAIHCFS